jgi:transketolase
MVKLRSMRQAYGEALAELGAANANVVVLDADVSASTQTWMFREKYPDRFFNVGVAEANMVDVAVGLALAGKIPFANTFAFLIALRAAEQVRTCVAYAKTNVKLVGSYGGLSDAFDGPTHHSICDLAVIRSLPNMTVIVAADAVEVKKAVPAVAEYDGPVYLRVSRAEVPVLFDESHEMRIGQGVTLREGGDATLIGTGIMVGRCLEAAQALRREGIDVRVIEIHTLKPIDEGLLVQAAQETGAIVTAEEHSTIGGLGAAVAEVLSGQCPVPILRVGITDTFAETGPYEALLDRYGMGVTDIVASAKQVVSGKNKSGFHP